jgi:hypothetical protein
MIKIHKIAIEMAAHGNISGTLSEWPYLREAFKEYGYVVKPTANKQEMQIAAKQIVLEQGW